MITEAKLPPRKGYVERVDNNGNHYYEKINKIIGYEKKVVILTESCVFTAPRARAVEFNIKLIGGGGSISANKSGSSGEIAEKTIMAASNSSIFVTIGEAGTNGLPGTPSAFGRFVAANGGQAGSGDTKNGLIIDGIEYGKGETSSGKASNGICIITYDAPVYD